MKKVKATAIITILFLVFSLLSVQQPVEAKTGVRLSVKNKTITAGKSFKLKVKNADKKATYKVSKKGIVKLTKKKKHSVTIKGLKKGTVKITVKVGKRKLTCKVKVMAKKKSKKSSSDQSNAPPAPSASNSETATTEIPTEKLPTVSEQPEVPSVPNAETETPTEEPPMVSEQPEVPSENEGNLTYAGSVSQEMCKASYWINKSTNPDKVLLSESEIKKLNQNILDTPGTNMYDLANMDPTFNSVSLRDSLATTSTPSGCNFVNGVAMTDKEAYYEAMRKNIRGADASEIDTIRYALCVKRANHKSWPTSDCIGNSASDTDDELQSSAIIVNEPVVVKLITADGKYSYAVSSNCTGWVETECLAFCASKEEWLEAWQSEEDFLVVTTDKITLEPSYIESATSKVELSLGCRLNLVPKSELPDSIGERGTWNNYVIYLPTRDEKGNYVKKPALISQHYSVSIGYLPLTERSLLNVAFSCLGNRYGWGGMLESMDCSLYTRSIYRCCGLELPRNTTWQTAIPTQNYDVSAMSQTEKKELLNQMPAGTLLMFSGHIMMYLGEDNGNYYVISDLGTVYDEENTSDSLKSIYSVVINTLDVRRGAKAPDGSRTWLSHLIWFICPWSVK